MKTLKQYITESQNFLVNKKLNNRQKLHDYQYFPKTRDELINIIIKLLRKKIKNLNCIDVSKITDMSVLFYQVNEQINVKDIDISEWDVSNVTNMRYMFCECNEFNADLSKWNVSNVKFIDRMFYGCTNFNHDLSNWDVSKVENMKDAFTGCTVLKKNNKIPAWYNK